MTLVSDVEKQVLLTVSAIIKSERRIGIILWIDQLEFIVFSRVTSLCFAGFGQPIHKSVGIE